MTSNSTCTTRFVRLPEVCRLIGLSRSQIYKMAKEATFPEPIRLSARAVAWNLSDVTRWMDDKAARSA